METASNKGLPLDDLESLWAVLAQHITEAGEKHEAVFLTKLAILLANEVGDYARVSACIEGAAQSARHQTV